MSEDINLKALWLEQETPVANLLELTEKAKKYQRSSLWKLAVTNLLLLTTSVYIGFIWYYYKPELITTKIGIIMVIAAMLMYLVVYNLLIPRLMKVGYEASAHDYLQRLLRLKEQQKFQYTTMTNIYYVMLALGIGLYMAEYTRRMSIIGGVTTYGITLAWFAFNWFYTRPRSLRKQQAKIDALIAKFKEVCGQLE